LIFGVLLAAPLALVHIMWRASLPQLDGSLKTNSVTKAVSIERDALGIPTITAVNRADLAFGTGFVHGQDRFFQMDLSRRLAAGELSQLFGAAAAQQDA
jgi:penicillin amidase